MWKIKGCCTLALALVAFGTMAQYQIDVTRYNESVYIYQSYFTYQGAKTGANAVVYADRDSVVVIDTPWDNDQTEQLLDWVATELKKPVAYFIITHSHEDRLGGISVLKQKGITSYSSRKTAGEAQKRGIQSPDKLFAVDSTFTLGNIPIEVFYPGPGHTVDNVVVYFPQEKVLYGGCFLKSSKAPDLGNLEDADVAAWPASLKRVQERFAKATLIIPGHGEWNPGSIENTAKLLKEYKR